MQKKISGWGNTISMITDYHSIKKIGDLNSLLENNEVIARGNGRSYGDSALSHTVANMLHFNAINDFNEKQGLITCEAGVLLASLLPLILSKGWFLPVTPGTQYITIGGAIASDIHGKNHHKMGCFSQHIEHMDVLQSDGKIIKCNKTIAPELFHTTCGGMGLTGIILRATIRLIRIPGSRMEQIITKTSCLEQTLEMLEQNNATYSVAWLDCLSSGGAFGRGIMLQAEHYEGMSKFESKRTLSISKSGLSLFLNSYSMQLFNALYYHSRRASKQLIDYQSFFYPLDGINHWNSLYGASGFVQYQLVIPETVSQEGIKNIVKYIKQSDQNPFLVVLKKLGQSNDNLLSFPIKGLSLALDFKMNHELIPFLNRLDQIVCEYGGRVYLTKDVCLSQKALIKMYPHVAHFREFRVHSKANKVFNSLQSLRLQI